MDRLGKEQESLQVICLATGSKCIGMSKRKDNGSIINDSHAEILARRLLLKYFYDQIRCAECHFDSIFIKSTKEGRFVLKPEVKFHLFTSHTPCGDCSIIPKTEDNTIENTTRDPIQVTRKRKEAKGSECEATVVDVKRRKEYKCNTDKISTPYHSFLQADSANKECKVDETSRQTSKKVDLDESSNSSQQQSLHEYENSDAHSTCQEENFLDGQKEYLRSCNDIHRTGAKCVPKGMQDPLLNGTDYHVIGALRTKPGRGEKTLSMSCSDKIMKWCTLGIQGGLLSNLLESPIYLDSIVIGKCPFSMDTMLRGISLRGRDLKLDRTSAFNYTCAKVYHCKNNAFPDSKCCVEERWKQELGFGKIAASGASILYCCEPAIHEVIVNGKKQGTTKKHDISKDSWSTICKSSLWNDFQSLLSLLGKTRKDASDLALKNYHNAKLSDQDYQLTRSRFFEVFPDWMSKPLQDEMFQ
ncbi:tRNA-specific adenosine deaminase 1-like isoform X2 [Rhopilema esculentum]|uniref:tRNA-specific adenosine deaminase 1-like isoform X2 n=1 Tax=Rhopilema esculentum TaxID=499914 RepID=UPI0031CEDAED